MEIYLLAKSMINFSSEDFATEPTITVPVATASAVTVPLTNKLPSIACVIFIQLVPSQDLVSEKFVPYTVTVSLITFPA
jgi:hypothetical protein